MKIAITGATGFIGKYAVDHFLNKGWEVIAIGREISKLSACFGATVINRETDYSLMSLLEILKGTDAIIHLAGKRFQKDKDPLLIEPYIESNIVVTQNILKAAEILNIQRVCQSSTIGVYSSTNTIPFRESDAPYAITVYGVSKLACEQLANLYSSKTNVKTTNLRLASLYGIGEKSGVVFMDYVNLARKKEKIEIWGEGKTSLDLVYVKDVILAIDKSISNQAPFGTYNVGSGQLYSVKTIAENINNVFDNQNNIRFLKNKREGDYTICMDSSKAKIELKWEPQWSMMDALADMKNILNENKK